MDPDGKILLVTVGTTRFDKLTQLVDTVEFQTLVRDRLHVGTLQVQSGDSVTVPCSRVSGLSVESFRFAPTLSDYMRRADLIITHCGAGTILEILRLDKPAIAVVNDTLLDNHQTELAHGMFRNQYMFVADRPDLLIPTIEAIDWTNRKTYPPGDPTPFHNLVHSLLGMNQ